MKPLDLVAFTHINIVSENLEQLTNFYIEVFGCIPGPCIGAQEGDWLSRGTGVPKAALQGMHLRLPGYGFNGPTLQIYQYRQMIDKPFSAANRKGLSHSHLESTMSAPLPKRY